MAIIESLVSRFREAATLVESTEGLIRVISHYDGDGICSGGILSKMLFRGQKRFHASNVSVLTKEDVAALDGGFSLLIVSDMGSSIAPDISARAMKLGTRCIILDHHQPDGRGTPYSISDGRGILEINPRFHSVNSSSGCCASTLAFLMAVAIDQKNLDLGVFALAGAIADRQNVPEFLELNSNIRTYLQNRGDLRSLKGLPLQGRTVGESLEMANDPFMTDLSGNPENVSRLLGTLGIDPRSTLGDLSKDKLKLLQSYLYVHMLRSGVDPGAVHELFRETVLTEKWGDVQSLAFEIDACGRVGDTGTGTEVIWGSAEARERAYSIRRDYRMKVQQAILSVKRAGPRKMEHIDVIEVAEDKMAGVLAGIAHNYLFSHSRPVLSVSISGGEAKISSRGNRGLCKKGLNLGKIMNESSKGIGGTGGGHDVAAGATVPADRIEEYLSAVDKAVGEQIGRKK